MTTVEITSAGAEHDVRHVHRIVFIKESDFYNELQSELETVQPAVGHAKDIDQRSQESDNGDWYLARVSGRSIGGFWPDIAIRLASNSLTSSLGPPVQSIELDHHPDPPQVTGIRRLKEDSGLTWDQLRRLFGVSLRTVHLWATGAKMNARNEERLALIEQAVRELDKSTPEERKAGLLRSPPAGGPSVFQRLLRSANRSDPVDIEALTESSGAGMTLHGDFLSTKEVGQVGESR